jgi:hypothetical protein
LFTETGEVRRLQIESDIDRLTRMDGAGLDRIFRQSN